MKTFYHIFISAIAIAITSYLLPGATVTILGAIVVAVVLAVINIFIKPIVYILTLPITIVTVGLFSLVLNALFVWFAAYLVPGFNIAGFWTAFFFAIILSLINMVFLPRKD